MTTRTLSELAGNNIIDSRDLVARFEELEQERADLESAVEEAEQESQNADNAVWSEEQDGEASEESQSTAEAAREALSEARRELTEWDEENGEELDSLRAINEEGEGYSSDWKHGETLILESYRADYAQEFAQDCGDLPRDIPDWLEIDWEQSAENFFRYDYTTVEIEGDTYYFRSC